MSEVFDAEYSSLHVRVTNKAAFHLYAEILGYKFASITINGLAPICRIHDIEAKYYADGENAFDMRTDLKKTEQSNF